MSERPHELKELVFYGSPVFICRRCGAYLLGSITWGEECPRFEPEPPPFGESPVSVGEALDRALSESVFERLDRKHRR
ncbi:MAG TPA: hypothetical protein VEX11_14775 [Acetobacteraceae bacterium]|nr:hypothetical protein [Acetobacteraceae bacterium]